MAWKTALNLFWGAVKKIVNIANSLKQDQPTFFTINVWFMNLAKVSMFMTSAQVVFVPQLFGMGIKG